MASVETGIRAALVGSTAITELVGTRIRPLGASPADAHPFLTYTVTSRESLPTLADGAADYFKAEFEIGIFADTYAEVMALSDVIRDRLDQFGETVAGVEFAPSMFDGESDVEEAVPEGSEKPVYVRVQTYRGLFKTT